MTLRLAKRHHAAAAATPDDAERSYAINKLATDRILRMCAQEAGTRRLECLFMFFLFPPDNDETKLHKKNKTNNTQRDELLCNSRTVSLPPVVRK